jgi:toxin secretion/phage lysis holin
VYALLNIVPERGFFYSHFYRIGGTDLDDQKIFKAIIAEIGCMFTYIYGGWNTCLKVLVWFIGIDYLTGVIGATIQQKLNSHKGFNGILRKSTILLVLIVAVLLDRLLNSSTWVFRTLVCYFYIANEGISILENVAKCGVPLPEKLMNTLEQLKNKGGSQS